MVWLIYIFYYSLFAFTFWFWHLYLFYRIVYKKVMILQSISRINTKFKQNLSYYPTSKLWPESTAFMIRLKNSQVTNPMCMKSINYSKMISCTYWTAIIINVLGSDTRYDGIVDFGPEGVCGCALSCETKLSSFKNITIGPFLKLCGKLYAAYVSTAVRVPSDLWGGSNSLWRWDCG